MEQKNWHVVRQTVGYHRYDTAAELELLNRIWALQGQLTNHFGPQQKLVKKIRPPAVGAHFQRRIGNAFSQDSHY